MPPKPKAVEGRACCRVDLAGGTLDIWPLGALHRQAATVNVAIDVLARVRLERRERGFRIEAGDEYWEASSLAELEAEPSVALPALLAGALELPPVDIVLDTGSPRGGGLGGSSALSVALIAAGEALTGRPPSSPAESAAMVRDLEARLMGLLTGVQDQYPPILGGALELRYPPGGETVRRLEVDLDRFGEHLLVAYTGVSHFSAGENWQVIRRRLDGDSRSVELFDGIARVASRVGRFLESGDFREVGSQMSEEWSYRRQLSDGISTPQIEEMLAAAADAGAWGGKATGAGGGGSVAVLAPREARSQVAMALEASGARILDARPSPKGVEVREIAPEGG